MLITCGHPDCKSTFETHNLTVRKSEQLLYRHNWVRRGTPTGVFYFCPGHDPDTPDSSKARRREQQQRGPRISSACPPGCRDRPLFELLGHDETGHRTARRLREHLVRQAYDKIPDQRNGDSPPNYWSEEFARSDVLIEMLLEMTGADIRRISGVGPQSLKRITEVLGRLD
jgi:hypothetical protein